MNKKRSINNKIKERIQLPFHEKVWLSKRRYYSPPSPLSRERGDARIDVGDVNLMIFAKKNNKNQRTNLTPSLLREGLGVSKKNMRYFNTLQNARKLRRTQTKAESIFWEKVRNRKFMGLKFNRQYIIEYAEIMGNKLFYIADFHIHAFKTIIEIDGLIHLQQKEYDAMRSANIEAIGFAILRFTNDDVIHRWDEVEKIMVTHFNSPPSPLSGERGDARN